MTPDDLQSVVNNLNWLGFYITPADIEWLETFDDPDEAYNEFMACNNGDRRDETLSAAERNR